jgi:hypothetical protein
MLDFLAEGTVGALGTLRGEDDGGVDGVGDQREHLVLVAG